MPGLSGDRTLMYPTPDPLRAQRVPPARPSAPEAGARRVVGKRARLLAVAIVLVSIAGIVAFVMLAAASPQARTATAALLLVAVAFFYLRSVTARSAVERMMREKEALLGITLDEARTDELTSLGNRRALAGDLAAEIATAGEQELLLAILDLDGFKQYNDSYGHAAGDSLLQRLGARLAAEAAGFSGGAYRMGGDEFCVFARATPENAESMIETLSTALHASGEGWSVGCSIGVAWIPSEATTVSEALKLADQRMYAGKSSPSASQQVTDALIAVFTEQSVFVDEHVERVAGLATQVAEALGLPEYETRRIGLAGRLHDIGKTAIPVAILEKPGPLDEREWEYMRQHTLIGERIVLAAPALAETAPLVRSSHERVDGNGYPDRLEGSSIPLGSRIIAVCDAFDAMTTDRIYKPAIDTRAALDELARHAGSQFDPGVVDALSKLPALRATLDAKRAEATRHALTSLASRNGTARQLA
jgi:diguanylate cyclase (GGDEF)-like protein